MATRTNLCPNPALKVDATGYFGPSGYARVTSTGSGMPRTTGYAGTTTGDIAPPKCSVTPGVTYRFSAYVYGVGTTNNITFNANWYTGGSYTSSSGAGSTSVAQNTAVRIDSGAVVAPAGVNEALFAINGLDSAAQVTGFLYEASSTLDTYFDGDSSGAVWTGTAGNSTSQISNGTAPSMRAAGTYLAGASGTSAVVPAPTGVLNNDIVLVSLYLETTATVTLPSGFTELTTAPAATGTQAFVDRLYWKRSAGSEPSTYTFSWTGSAWRDAFSIAYKDCVTSGSPIDVQNNAARSTTGNTTPAVTVTTTGSDRQLVWIGASWIGGPWNPPSGYTERVDNGSSGAMGLADLTQGIAGSSGSITGTTSSTAASQTAWLIALKPLATVTSTKTGGGAIGAAGSGPKIFTREKTGSGAVKLAGSGPKALTTGTTFTKTGGAVSTAAGSGPKAITSATTYTKTGSGALVSAGSGAKTIQHQKAGSAVAGQAGSGSKTITTATTYTKTGSGAARLAGSGPKSVINPAVISTKSGGAVAGLAGSGGKTITSPVISTKTGAGAVGLAGSGAKTTGASTTFTKTGSGAVRAAGSGAKVVLSAAVFIKTGSAAPQMAGSGAKVVTSATVYLKTGSGALKTAGSGPKVVVLANAPVQKFGGGAAGLAGTGTKALVLAVTYTKTGAGTVGLSGTGFRESTGPYLIFPVYSGTPIPDPTLHVGTAYVTP